MKRRDSGTAAALFDEAADRVSYSADAPPATFTFAAWVMVEVDRNDFSTFARLWNGGGTVATLATDADGTAGPAYFTAAGSIGPISGGMPVGVWRKVAATRTGGTGQIMAAPVGGATTVLSNPVSTAVPTGITLGGRGPGDASEWFHGRKAYARLWDGVLSLAQIEAEWASRTPVVTSGLWAHWPLQSNLLDASGNGRHLTAGGTAVDYVSGPPI